MSGFDGMGPNLCDRSQGRSYRVGGDKPKKKSDRDGYGVLVLGVVSVSAEIFAHAKRISTPFRLAALVTDCAISSASIWFDIATGTMGWLDLRVAMSKTAVRQGVDRLRWGYTYHSPPVAGRLRVATHRGNRLWTPQFGPPQTHRGSSRSRS